MPEQAGRFADLVALVRFALEQHPILKPFAESVHERFEQWLRPVQPARRLGKAHQLFGDALPALLEELNEVLAA